LPQDWILGRLLHTLIGYNDAPNGAQLLAYGATIVMILALMRWERHHNKGAFPRSNAKSGEPVSII
jgi:high-affinity iron transporter